LSITEFVRIRKDLDIIKRVSTRDAEESNKRLLKLMKAEYDKRVIRDYKRDLLYYHFRNQEHIVSRFVRSIYLFSYTNI
jgi:hypothetical protein